MSRLSDHAGSWSPEPARTIGTRAALLSGQVARTRARPHHHLTHHHDPGLDHGGRGGEEGGPGHGCQPPGGGRVVTVLSRDAAANLAVPQSGSHCVQPRQETGPPCRAAPRRSARHRKNKMEDWRRLVREVARPARERYAVSAARAVPGLSKERSLGEVARFV